MYEELGSASDPTEHVREAYRSNTLRKHLKAMIWSNEELASGKVKIGNPFPKSDLIVGTSRTAWTLLSGPTLLFLIVIPELTGPDPLGFNESAIHFGVAWDEGLVHLLVDFSGWLTAEAPMDPYQHTESENEHFISAGGRRQNVPIVLIEGSDDLVCGIRILPLRPEVTGQIRRLYAKSVGVHHSQRSVHRAIALTEEVSHPDPGDLFDDRTVVCQQFS